MPVFPRPRPAALAGALVFALASTAPAAHAEPPPPTTAVDLPGVAVAPAVDPARRIETARSTRPVAPGVSLSSFDWYELGGAGGWIRGDALTVDLTAGTKVDYLYPGHVAAAEPLSAQANRTRAVAAVNGDFFDINNSNAPRGVGVQDGRTVKSPEVTIAVTVNGVTQRTEVTTAFPTWPRATA
ncbi:hypothetical protein A6A25_24585 [Saccharothrix sp. CB00851]|nr:hypothetical protein A6A25_24585 [Saccharothrix sp. CB00851]